jgi:hypothetical protein
MATLKWKGDELFLGATKMAHVRPMTREDGYLYVIGPDDHVSEPYQDKEDARNDCCDHVRLLLKKAGA